MKIKKYTYLAVGFVCTALGAVGAVLPILPTVPFLMLAAFCFAKSSQRLHRWFVNTKLYQKNLKTYVEQKSMTMAAKCRILGMVSAIMLVGFIMMKQVPVGRAVLAVVWVLHVLYFVFGIKTLKKETASNNICIEKEAKF